MNLSEIAARLREAADEAQALAIELLEDARKARELAGDVTSDTPPSGADIAERGKDLFCRSLGQAMALDIARRPPPQQQEGQPMDDPRSRSRVLPLPGDTGPGRLPGVARAKVLRPLPRPRPPPRPSRP